MEIEDAINLIAEEVRRCLRSDKLEVHSSTLLVGESGIIDSVTLIELCVGLEDKASELGFEFDWTSDSAMSRSRSMFNSVESLADEFLAQLNGAK